MRRRETELRATLAPATRRSDFRFDDARAARRGGSTLSPVGDSRAFGSRGSVPSGGERGWVTSRRRGSRRRRAPTRRFVGRALAASVARRGARKKKAPRTETRTETRPPRRRWRRDRARRRRRNVVARRERRAIVARRVRGSGARISCVDTRRTSSVAGCRRRRRAREGSPVRTPVPARVPRARARSPTRDERVRGRRRRRERRAALPAFRRRRRQVLALSKATGGGGRGHRGHGGVEEKRRERRCPPGHRGRACGDPEEDGRDCAERGGRGGRGVGRRRPIAESLPSEATVRGNGGTNTNANRLDLGCLLVTRARRASEE